MWCMYVRTRRYACMAACKHGSVAGCLYECVCVCVRISVGRQEGI